MKKITTIITIFALLLSISIPTVATDAKILSEMSEDECIEFVHQNNIEIPDDYSEDVWAPFVKGVIEIVEANPRYEFAFNYTVTLEFANAIKEAVNDYYGILLEAVETNSISENTTLSSIYVLQDSTAITTWMPQFSNFNCYIFSIGTPQIVWKDPGFWSNQQFDLSMAILDIADLAKDDLTALGHQRVWYNSNIDTSNLCENEKIICVRRGTFDYHFMKLENNEWQHKPGNSAILKYNHSLSVMRKWSNERMLASGAVEPSLYYDSQIIYISYDGHDWEYASNANGTHTKSCSICGDEFTEQCALAYTSTDSAHHRAECTDCDYRITSEACSFSYTSNGDDSHTKECEECDNSTVLDCEYQYIYNYSEQHYKNCTVCGSSTLVECTHQMVYCGNDTVGDVHMERCVDCRHSAGSTYEACTFEYEYYGVYNNSNAHIYACTTCGHVDGVPTPCLCVGLNPCELCGHVNDHISLGIEEEELVE